MSALSNYLENALAAAVLCGSTFTSPASLWLALYSTDPGEDNSGTEISVGDYARQQVTFGAPSNGVCANASTVEFPVASASYNILYSAVLDASTSGNLLWYGAVSASKAVAISDQYKVSSGCLRCSLA